LERSARPLLLIAAPSLKEVIHVKSFFKKSIGPSLVLVLLVELVFALAQPHWLLVTLALTIINMVVFVAIRLVKRREISQSS
jgi:hypothetical protein